MAQTGRASQRLMIANRGEIAARIISAARELDLITIALYTDDDIGHTYNATEAVKLSSPSVYLDINELARIAKQHNIDSIHPGYGFLSESAAFAQRMSDEGILVIGPGAEILERTGDKLRARMLALECQVPVLPALATPTSSVGDVEMFAKQHGLPIMIKAVDGGGGRGIRLVRSLEELKSLATRAIEESPSKQVFAERAAIDGFRHVEIQIVGDGQGNVIHLWERECSIQRRYQKVIELALSTADRAVVKPVIDAAVGMAEKIKYKSLGTFEFLLNAVSGEYFFLEINPRLQVEHTITESICAVDIVKAQIRLAQGASLQQAGLAQPELPRQIAIQLRVAAEDPERNWSLSAGKILSFRFPVGNGVRVDTALVPNTINTISTDFDSVIAKIILTASTWQDVVSKAKRALEDTQIVGVKTNVAMLAAIVAHPDFQQARCDTQWLEAKHEELLAQSRTIFSERSAAFDKLSPPPAVTSSMSISTASTLFRKDDAWSIALTALPTDTNDQPQNHHLRLLKVLKNDFPSMLTAQVAFTAPSQAPVEYLMDVQATAASASALSAQHRRGDSSNASHIVIPFAGKLVEICVDEGDSVKKGDCIAVVQQMKMELEIRSSHDGIVTWVCEIDDGDDVSEGVLAAIVEDHQTGRSKL